MLRFGASFATFYSVVCRRLSCVFDIRRAHSVVAFCRGRTLVDWDRSTALAVYCEQFLARVRAVLDRICYVYLCPFS
jgi:hypothetical protein